MEFASRIFNWSKRKVESRRAPYVLATMFFLETFLFVPLDPLLAFFCVQRKRDAKAFAALAVSFSVLGGLLSYALGAGLWEVIGAKLAGILISKNTFDLLVLKYKYYGHWVVFFGGLLPVPFKAVTLSAGFCRIPLIPFITAALAARGLRFFAVALVSVHWSEKIKVFVDRHFHHLVVLASVKFSIFALGLWLLVR
ncbi:hypothetical protein HOD08_02430 [bacterium]|nr:hypothetical protein [bacterium]